VGIVGAFGVASGDDLDAEYVGDGDGDGVGVGVGVGIGVDTVMHPCASLPGASTVPLAVTFVFMFGVVFGVVTRLGLEPDLVFLFLFMFMFILVCGGAVPGAVPMLAGWVATCSVNIKYQFPSMGVGWAGL
jgi:hypothetical protein